MRIRKILPLAFFIVFVGCRSQETDKPVYESENLRVEKLTAHTFVHVSYLETQDYGKVPCNGMVVIHKGEAVVFDTPTNIMASDELINWIENQDGVEVKAVVATHFHDDCLGGLEAFHRKNITSYATKLTKDLAEDRGVPVPQNGFESHLELMIGGKKVISEFLGEGHTRDNIIGYLASDKVMFGGCLIKSDGAGKGNLNDANTKEWSNTVERLKAKYPDVEVVIPGHGDSGGIQLLDYTIDLFKE
ncbi:subclass B1 metallo-beta-lactamase [Maribacter luteus]|uniref:beta-lactamase n=1 Tax=Maribacter luteus TaxID=2594478 RepID=A0A6I2MQA9_9FLAO|nr:subclass B1 metallo-beta-lactamase [Maribacter luteus]MRX65009.1 subclass B1 metallo-beta-lactamase [Maribacter luteus]